MSEQIGKTKDQGWQIGVRRTLPVGIERAWDIIMSELGLEAAAPHDDPVYKKGMSIETADKTKIEIRSYDQGSMIRMRWHPQGWEQASTLQIRILPAKTGTTFAIHHERLTDADHREAMRAHWTDLLDKINAALD